MAKLCRDPGQVKMEKKTYRIFFCSLLLCSGCFRLVQSLNTLSPNDATVPVGANAVFQCNFDSAATSPFIWASYSPKPSTIYVSGSTITPDGTQYLVNGTGPYTLTVVNAQPNDALVYCCYTITDINFPSCANLVVIVSVTPSVNGNNPSTGLIAGSNTIALLTCQLLYSRPVPEGSNPIYAYNPNQDPALTMQVGPNDVTQSSSGFQIIANGSNALSIKSLSYNASITSSNVGPTLNCTISSTAPFMNNVTNIPLNILGPVMNVVIYNNNSNGTVISNISPGAQFYIGSSMNCTAINVYPIPQITWSDLLTPSNTLYGTSGLGWSAVTVPSTGQSHSWNCSAGNSYNTNPVNSTISFTVIGGTTSAAKSATTNNVGLGVGLGIGLGVPILLAIIILIIVLRRRRAKKSPPPYTVNEGEKTKKSMDTGAGKSPTNKNGKNPDPLPAVRNNVNPNPNPSYVTPVMPEQIGTGPKKNVRDSPGYGDIGVKHLGGSGSIPQLNESFDSHHDRSYDVTRPPPKGSPNGGPNTSV